MPHTRKLLLTCATHLLGLALGWQAWVLAHSSSNTSRQSPHTSSKRPTSGASMSTEDIFALVQSQDEVTRMHQADDKFQADFARVLSTLEVPDNIEAALTTELEVWLKDDPETRKLSPKIAALIYHWAARDIAGFMKWGESGAGPQEAFLWHSIQAFDKIAENKGPGSLADGLTGQYSVLVAHTIAANLGLHGDLDRTLSLKGTLPAAQWELVRDRFASIWPMNRKDDILKLATTEGKPELLLEFVKRRGAEGATWFSQMLASGSLDASFTDQMSKSPMWNELAKSGSILPLDDRLEQMRASGDPNRDVISQIAQSDITRLLKEGRDWRYAFRHGEADAAQVLAEISKSLPELASKSPDALRAQVYIQLVEEDPTRAATLLEGLPADQRLKLTSQAIQSSFVDIDPNAFLTALQQFPSDTPEQWDARLAAWNHKSNSNLRRLSDDYVEWVRQLPPGIDREMAMYSLVAPASHLDPALSAEMRAAITDPALKQKLAEAH